MRAIRVHQFGEPEVLQLEEVADLQPSGKQVVIDVRAVGVNPVDTYIRSGLYPIKPELPYIPGKDAAGEVSAVGSEVSNFKVGDRVYCCDTSSYAEQILCSEARVFPLPDGVDFNAGAAIGVPYSTAYFAMFYRAHALPGETMLVHGASGAVGLAALQLAKSHGIRAIGTAGTEAGLELIRQQGAIAAFNHNSPGYLDQISDLTNGQGIDVILEMLANVNLQNDLDLLAKFGRVMVIGNRGSIEINPRAIMGKNATILGMTLFNVVDEQFQTMHAAIGAGLANGSLKPVIKSVLPLAEAAKAHELVMQPGAAGKIVLTT